MALPSYRVTYPPFKVVEFYQETGITNAIFEDSNVFDMAGEFTKYATFDPTVAATPLVFTFPHITDGQLLYWEFADKFQNNMDRVQMVINYTVASARPAATISNLRRYYFCFIDDVLSIEFSAQVGASIPLKVIVMG